MEEKKIYIKSPSDIPYGVVHRDERDWISAIGPDGQNILLGAYSAYNGETARKFAHAILELIGDPVPGKGDDCYIAVTGNPHNWGGGEILGGISDPRPDVVGDFMRRNEGEFHIFRRVATVGPIPQPERKVTRYE